MNEPEYFYLNPLSSVIDENKIMIKTGTAIYWLRQYNLLGDKLFTNKMLLQ